ncbi:hypothetical protein RvY_04778-2 [Ramazzottius varieornatus]|uniref:DUF4209 domain-containing protein n=1 Tax=Ramazzottius varieornatus TaxID=947166 RepID=A0A1D1V1Y1_RAMVA|nr:hypothetical protein RvY_04778-2 [Ramazzottius varieornatus]
MNGLDMRSLGEDLFRAFQTAPVPVQSKPVWTRIAEEMVSNKSSWTALQLLLPQFETILRIVFARVNKQEFRVLTAEQDEFFTTFDEILAVNVGSEENGIRSVLGDKYLIFLLDLLIYPKGPRIRHRISHGEVDEQHCPIYLINAVIVAVIGVLAKVSSHEQSSSLDRIIQHYEPQFHPVDELRRKYQSFLSSLRTLEAWPTIAGYSRSIRTEEAFSAAFCAVDNGAGSSWFAMLGNTLRDCPFESLYRPASECPVTKLIHSIIDNADLSVVNIGEFLRIRHSTYVKDGSIPRQSESNYLSLIQLLPPLIQAWMETFLQTLWLFQRVQREPDHPEMARFLTWLRKTLQVWQNVGKLSASYRNDWPKVLSWLARLSPPPTRQFAQFDRSIRWNRRQEKAQGKS